MCLGSTAILLCEPIELAGALLAAPKPQAGAGYSCIAHIGTRGTSFSTTELWDHLLCCSALGPARRGTRRTRLALSRRPYTVRSAAGACALVLAPGALLLAVVLLP